MRFVFLFRFIQSFLESGSFLSILMEHALTSPTSISKIRTPSPHQSTARVYDVSVRTSGAKNSGVPQNVLVRSLKPIPERDTEAL